MSVLNNGRGSLFRPTIIRNDGSNSDSYLIRDTLESQTYSKRFANTNLESSSSFRYGDKPYLVSTQQLRLDWSKFENHTFFHSAVSNVNESFDKIVNFYPFDKSEKEIEKYEDDLTGFEKWVLDSFPKNVGYLNFSGSNGPYGGNIIEIVDKRGVNIESISSERDGTSVLDPVNSPFSIEFFMKVPEEINDNQVILQKFSNNRNNFTLALSQSNSTSECEIYFSTIKTNTGLVVSGSIPKGEFVHCSAFYYVNDVTGEDAAAGLTGRLFLLVNETLTQSPNRVFYSDLSFPNTSLLIGSGSEYIYNKDAFPPALQSFKPRQSFSGSIDELKFFHKYNTPENIKKNKFKSYYPQKNDNMKLYLKFNEPYGEYSGNNVVLDSSGNSLHGRIENFNTDCRLTGSDVPVTAEEVKRNPILFPSYESVDSLNQQLLTTASLYDDFNPNLITKLIPQHYFQDATNFRDFNEEFDAMGQFFKSISNSNVGKNRSELPSMQLLIKLLLTYAKFFDEIKLMIDGMTDFMHTQYDDFETTPDVFLIEKAKLTNTILPHLMSYGNVDQLFKGINLDDQKSKSTKSLVEIQNLIWRRLLSEASRLKSRKGTAESIKGIFRNAGIEPDNILDFREYGGAKIKSLDASKESKKDVIYLLNFTGSIGRTSSNLNAQGYPTDNNLPHIKSGFLSGSRIQPGKPLVKGTFVNKTPQNIHGVSDEPSDGLFTSGSFTYEGLYSWPRGYQFVSESLARLQLTGSSAPSSTESCIFNLIADDNKLELHFKEHQSSDTAVKKVAIEGLNVFDKGNWFVSFGKKNLHDIENSLSSSYFLRAIKQRNAKVLEEHYTSSFFREGSDSALKIQSSAYNASGSFISVGSQSFNGVGSFLNDHGDSLITGFSGFIGNLRFFSKFIDENEALTHAKSYTNYGVSDPKVNYNFNNIDSGSFERLVLHTDLKQNTKAADASGNFRLFDFSQNNIHFEGSNFENDVVVLKPERVNYEILSDKFDLNYSKDKIRVRSFQDLENKSSEYFAEFAPIHDIIVSEESLDDNRLSLDMSVMKGSNRNILNSFGSLDIFENALGQPNLIFGEHYPDLENIRKIYFNNFLEKLDLQKYRELFKWIDNSFTDVIYSITPRTTNFLGINFIYESHVLERNKFKYRYDQIYLEANEREDYTPNDELFGEATSFGNIINETIQGGVDPR